MEETVHYTPLGSATDAEWLSLSTPGFGYVRLGPENRTFVVTMFHELHCLRMLNLAFAPNMTSFPHVKHCLNYLRQGILCSPDLALEPGDFEEKDLEVERTHGVHECKDWPPIYNFVAQNYDGWSKDAGYGACDLSACCMIGQLTSLQRIRHRSTGNTNMHEGLSEVYVYIHLCSSICITRRPP